MLEYICVLFEHSNSYCKFRLHCLFKLVINQEYRVNKYTYIQMSKYLFTLLISLLIIFLINQLIVVSIKLEN